MTVSDYGQARVFLINVAFGFLCVMVFDVFRALRRSGKKSALYVNLTDILCFISLFLIVFFASVKFNFGALRYYQLMGLGTGAFLNVLLLSRFEVRFFVIMIKFAANSARFLKKALSFPILLLYKIFAPILTGFEDKTMQIFSIMWKKLDKLKKKRLKNIKILKKRMKMM